MSFTELAKVPVADWVTQEELLVDPDAVADRLREESPIAFVPFMNLIMFSRFDFVQYVLTHNDTHTVVGADGGTTDRAVGPSLMRQDQPEHTRQRQQVMQSFRPRAVEEHWTRVFTENAERALAALIAAGPGADIDALFARPFAGDNLAALIGIPALDYQTIVRWSHAMTAGSANIFDDPEVWARSDAAGAEADEAIREAIPYLRRNPDASLLSVLVNSDDRLPDEVIRANVKLAISGGVNEPQHTVTNGVWLFSKHPDQLARAIDEPRAFLQAFDEVVRVLPPIYMMAKKARPEGFEIDGLAIPPDAILGVFMLAANRDPRQFDRPADFDILRRKRPNLTFGAGIHACAGSFVAKSAIGGVAWPLLYRRLRGLRAVDASAHQQQGWVFRSLGDLPVTWDEVVD